MYILNKFSMGDKVYHITGGEFGIVTDVTYRLSCNLVWYHVTFDPDRGEVACRDFELSTEKAII